MTATLILFCCVLAGDDIAPASKDPSKSPISTPSKTENKPRPYHEISREMHSIFAQEAKAVIPEERGQAVAQIARLYQEVSSDPRLARSETLAEYRQKLWNRLRHVKLDAEAELRPARSKKSDPPDHSALLTDEAVERAIASAVSSEESGSSSQTSRFSGSHIGSGANGGAAGGNGGGAVPNNAQQLIELIERTIRPDSWSVNGGKGTMYYYSPVHALVVRASSEIHLQIRGLFGGLREAGGAANAP